MGQFYYTVSSLPTLVFGEPCPLDYKEYLSDCKKWLKESQWQEFCSACIEPNLENPLSGVAEEYRQWEISLRNDLVLQRASAIGIEGEAFLKEGASFPDTAALASAALKESSPLKAEEVLNKGRWDYIESLKSGHFFDFETLILYSLQLQISQRMGLFEEEVGYGRYRQIYENILKQLDDDARGDQS